MSPSVRQKLTQIALGDGAIKDPGIYSSIHQESLEHKYGGAGNLIGAGACEDTVEAATDIIFPNM